MTDEPTTRELDRRLDRIDRTIEAGFAKIDARLDKMVNAEMFALYQRNTDQRMSTIETDIADVDGRRAGDRQDLQAAITQAEQNRADDRRMLIKAGITASATIVAAVLGVFLPLLLM